jgi:peptidoglycan-N-acetylglucosamine deacetylase
VWVTSLGAIAEHVRSLELKPRSVERPDESDF